jgi:hypothetical protein
MNDNNRQIPTITADIATLINDLEKIKTEQPVGGDSWVFYRNQSALAWDLTLPANVALYKVTFLPNAPNRPCAANLLLASDISWNPDDPKIIPAQDGTNHCWYVLWDNVLGQNNAGYNYKFQIPASQKGTFSIVRIS